MKTGIVVVVFVDSCSMMDVIRIGGVKDDHVCGATAFRLRWM